jgi:hypothetical protein
MIDRSEHTDHRRNAAMMTDQASHRGWDFRDDQMPPLWFRAVAEVLRPRSIIILLALAGVISLWWMT